jgi:hypothetical protein
MLLSSTNSSTEPPSGLLLPVASSLESTTTVSPRTLVSPPIRLSSRTLSASSRRKLERPRLRRSRSCLRLLSVSVVTLPSSLWPGLSKTLTSAPSFSAPPRLSSLRTTSRPWRFTRRSMIRFWRRLRRFSTTSLRVLLLTTVRGLWTGSLNLFTIYVDPN